MSNSNYKEKINFADVLFAIAISLSLMGIIMAGFALSTLPKIFGL